MSIDLRKTECLERVTASSGRKKRRGTGALRDPQQDKALVTCSMTRARYCWITVSSMARAGYASTPNQQHPPWQAVVLL